MALEGGKQFVLGASPDAPSGHIPLMNALKKYIAG
jgi:hypothetical protein